MDLLFGYLTDSTVSPLQAYFVNEKSFCSKVKTFFLNFFDLAGFYFNLFIVQNLLKVTYQIQEYRESHVMLSFMNTRLDCLEQVKPDLDVILKRILNEKFDTCRMQALVKMKISQINDKFEDEPHQTASRVCIGDFLYGSLENQAEFTRRFSQSQIFEDLKKEPVEFWLELLEKWLVKACSAVVVARPCEKMAKAIGDEDRTRVEERKISLGKKKLKELKRIVENAIEENDVSCFEFYCQLFSEGLI